jgi:hypothetical protein
LKEIPDAKGFATGEEAGHRAKADVGQEFGLGRFDVSRGGLDLPTSRDQIGAATNQVHGEFVGQRDPDGIEQVRTSDGQTAVGALPDQHREAAASRVDGAVSLRFLLFGTRHLRIRQTLLLPAAQTARDHTVNQRERFAGAF